MPEQRSKAVNFDVYKRLLKLISYHSNIAWASVSLIKMSSHRLHLMARLVRGNRKYLIYCNANCSQEPSHGRNQLDQTCTVNLVKYRNVVYKICNWTDT